MDTDARRGRWQKLSDEALKNARLTFEGDKHTVKVGNPTFTGTHKLDPTKMAKTIDISDTDGPLKGKTVLGIYELGGNELCLSRQGPPPRIFCESRYGQPLSLLEA
jgi:uncharacterized protein (TIGR03067 family)